MKYPGSKPKCLTKIRVADLYLAMPRKYQWFRWSPGLLLYLCISLVLVSPLHAQLIPEAAPSQDTQEELWTPPDLSGLQADWWQELQFSVPKVFEQRSTQLLDSAVEAVKNLEGENLSTAQNIVRTLRSQISLMNVAVQTPLSPEFDRILTTDSYTIDDVLTLQSQLRELAQRQQIPSLRVGQLQHEALLAQQKQSPLLRQYEAADASAPARLLLGLSRFAARVEFELARVQQRNLEKALDAIQVQSELVNQQLEFARAHIVRGEVKLADVEVEADQARARIENLAERIAATQLQLRNILSAGETKPSLEVLRKQQLVRVSVDRTLATMQAAFHDTRATWYRFRSDILSLNFDLLENQATTRALISATEKQLAVWTEASETTLVTPVRSSELNAIKNMELAHTAARETLALIEQIRATSDDLSLVQEIFSTQLVDGQSGIGASWTKLKFFSSSFTEQIFKFVDFELFQVGSRPVTPGGIFLMFVILAIGFALSWFLRHLLDRVGKNRKYKKSPALYTVGRLLHYIIIIAALFAALGSLGLDFTNFALIAGALSVGIGFGLQSVVNNLVSGLILLFEGSLRVGDYIELNTGISGVVKEINTRATVINTNDSVDVVVPNSEFVNNQLTNWTLREPMARMRLGFGVAYGSDKELVKKAALEAADETEFVLHNMPGREPEVRLINFGDSSLDFHMLVWVSRAGVRRPQRVNASFLWNLETKLGQYGIEIPFPQRDVHIIKPSDKAPAVVVEPEKPEEKG